MESGSGCPRFDADFTRLEALASQHVTTADALVALLGDMYRIVYNVDLDAYDSAALREAGPQVLERAFQLSLVLQDRTAEWHRKGLMSLAVQTELRNVFRATRYAADMLGEMLIEFDDLSVGEEEYLAFTGPHRNTTLHPSLGGRFELRSGDVLLVRGTLHNSAAIARIGDVDSQFSHVGIVYVDPRGAPSVVEALITEGGTITPLPTALSHGLARAIVFRHPDATLAASAAYRIHERVRKSRRWSGDRILYDFSMKLDDYDRLFCSKLVRQAFDEASHGIMRLPTFRTTFRTASPDFLQRIGVTADETFAPGDMELEPDFQPIAEWRDYRKTSLVRLQDMVMVKMFSWMEQDGYRFRATTWIWLMSMMGKTSGYLPDGVKNRLARFVPKVPQHMTRRAVAAIAMLHYTAQPLLEKLLEHERQTIREKGRPLHPREIHVILDRMASRSRSRIGYLRRSRRTRMRATTSARQTRVEPSTLS